MIVGLAYYFYTDRYALNIDVCCSYTVVSFINHTARGFHYIILLSISIILVKCLCEP